jgi:hypothetical protein
MDPETIWWSLADIERAALERAVDHIIFGVYQGDRGLALSLIRAACNRGLDARSSLVSVLLWLMAQKVDQDE